MGWGLNPSAAVEFGRVHNQLYPTTVEADNVYPADLLDDLRHKGHNITGLCGLLKMTSTSSPLSLFSTRHRSSGGCYTGSSERG